VSRAWRDFARNLRKPIEVERTVAPADIVPGFQPATAPDNTAAEEASRIDAAIRAVDAALQAERAKPEHDRNHGVYALALDVRLALEPMPRQEPLLRAMAPRFGSFGGYVQ
jgi:hypothetical protein